MKNLIRPGLYSAALIAVVAHTDVWWWNSSRLVLGLPIGLLYHLVFCFAVAGLMGLFVALAWPQHLEEDSVEPVRPAGDQP